MLSPNAGANPAQPLSADLQKDQVALLWGEWGKLREGDSGGSGALSVLQEPDPARVPTRAQIPEIKDYKFGPDLGLDPDRNHDFCIVVSPF